MPHLVVLYYVNDSDGDTIIYDQIGQPNNIDKSALKIKQKISPKKGRCVLFNGKWLHNSSSPQNSPRCILNFDVA